MADSKPNHITRLLHLAGGGDADARSRLFGVVYDDIARIAHNQLRGENRNAMLQTADLVNEAYLRLFGEKASEWKNRAHFFAYAASAMRHFLVDQARRRQARKRGGDLTRITLTDVAAEQTSDELIMLDSALDALASIDRRKSHLVELRFFAGLSIDELSRMMALSPATIHKELKAARGWLYNAIEGGQDESGNDALSAGSGDSRTRA